MVGLLDPPESQSLAKYVRHEWARIIRQWEHGWPSETSISDLEQTIRQRAEDIDDGTLPDQFDWRRDYDVAGIVHRSNVDFVAWRRAYNETLSEQWLAWARDNSKYLSEISLEGLRSMILIHGAAVIAALGVISGQVGAPNQQLALAAKVMVTFSLCGLFATAIGFMIIFAYGSEATWSVRWKMVRPIRHRRLYAMGRYIRVYFGRKARFGNYFAYGSILMFIIGASISLIIVLGPSNLRVRLRMHFNG
jgi:hypothetical protein